MTIDEAVNTWMPVVAMGVKDMPEVKEAVRMAIASLEAWKKVRQEVQAINAYEVLTDGEVHINSCKNKTGLKVKMEALAIIDKHLQEVKE